MEGECKKKIFKPNIKFKLSIVGAILILIPLLFLGVNSYKYTKDELENIGKKMLENNINYSLELIKLKQEEVKEGRISTEQAQEQIKKYFTEKKIRYDSSVVGGINDLGKYGYYIICNKDGQVITHPTLESQTIWNLEKKDKQKSDVLKECMEKGKSGGGFTYYTWKKEDTGVLEKKIAYTVYEPKWEWYISATVYASDFNKGANRVLDSLIFILILSILGGLILIITISNQIAEPITEIASHVKNVEAGNYIINMPYKLCNRADEIGILARSIEGMNAELDRNFNRIYSQNIQLVKENIERKKAEMNLLLTSEVIENTREAILILDNNANIIYVNKFFIETTGYLEEEIINKHIRNVGKVNDQIYNEICKKVESDCFWSGEIYNIKKNGDRYPISLSVKSIKSEFDNKIHYIIIFQDLTTIKANEENINYLKQYDILTKLPKKSIFVNKLNEVIKEARESNKVAAVMTLGLDDFKFINEAIGHILGDEVLVKVSERLREHIKDIESLARITGDEFGIILNNINKMGCTIAKAKEILGIFREPFMIEGKEIFITASIGISIFPIDGQDSETLIMNAVAAQNNVKKKGKNNYQIYSKKMNEDAFEKLEMITSLRHAAENKEFILHYQPQVDLETGTISGMEALIRWNHPKLGFIYPDKFISLAEKTGIIVPISEWVIEEACMQNKKLHDMGYDYLVVAVNLSPLQFQKKNLAKTIKNILKKTRLSPEYLEIEITEGILMENIEEAIEILLELKEIGVKISIDDFGTGYSSLNYLREFPIDKLKIDRSFIKGIPTKDKGAIANIIIQLAKSLNLKVTAEGSETKEQVEFLKMRRCDEIQGYYFSKPLSKKEFTKLLMDNIKLV